MRTSPPTAQLGSLEIFWPLIEPVLSALQPRRMCEIGVADGALTERLLAWAAPRDCVYVGIDPAPGQAISGRFDAPDHASAHQLLRQTSHAALPGLPACDVYFIDGDHNHYTVSGELRLIAAAHTAHPTARALVIFMHDVAWPWSRRDMYYLPTSVPPDARHPWSETLGVPLDGEELIEGGLREPGRYAIAALPGGPRNGVLTAVEDFLASAAGAGWTCAILPIAYGLAMLHRPADPALSPEVRARLEELARMAATGGTFLRACEENLLRLYFYGEYHRHAAVTESSGHHATLQAYDDLLAHNGQLERAYQTLLAHSHALQDEYDKLSAAHAAMQERAGSPASASPPSDRPPTQFE